MVRFVVFIGWIGLFLSSCSEYDGITESKETRLTTFSLSMDQGLEIHTGYTPMVRAKAINEGVRIMITNAYRVYIMKEAGNKWIIEKALNVRIDPADVFDLGSFPVRDNTLFHHFSTELRPGNYRMTIITGGVSLGWNDQLTSGTVVADSDNPEMKTPWACTYKKVGGGGYLFEGWRSLQEEVFTGTVSFTLSKTDDLHSEPKPKEFPVRLHRMVSKVRMLLDCKESESGNRFYPEQPHTITADLKATEGRSFCLGLDVWGKPYYENPSADAEGVGYVTNMKFITYCWQSPYAPLVADNGNKYLLGMYKETRQYAPFFFSDPDRDELPVRVSEVEVLGSSTFPLRYVYAFPAAGCNREAPRLVLRHNSLCGLVFSPDNGTWKDPRSNDPNIQCVQLQLVTDSEGSPLDARSIFDDFFEYRLRGY